MSWKSVEYYSEDKRKKWKGLENIGEEVIIGNLKSMFTDVVKNPQSEK